jgi:hypothetical protein
MYKNGVVSSMLILSQKSGHLTSNMFAYCLNNPVNRVDENGMFSYYRYLFGVGSVCDQNLGRWNSKLQKYLAEFTIK